MCDAETRDEVDFLQPSRGSNAVDQGLTLPDTELVPIGAPTERLFTNALLWATFSMLNEIG